MNPSSFEPITQTDFIGPARNLAAMLCRKATHAGPHKLLLIGPPGTGKTSLANYFAGQLTPHEVFIESVNGRNLSVERVREWEAGSHYRPLAGQFSVKVVNEAQAIQPAAADALRTYLDSLPDHCAVVLTANGRLADLPEPLQSRAQQFPVAGPAPGDIAELLHKFGLNGESNAIAQGCRGNVRAALLDAQSVLDLKNS